MEIGRHPIEQDGLVPALDGGDDRPLARAASGRERVAGETVEAFGDHGAFADAGAVGELQNGRTARGVIGEESRRTMRAVGRIHRVVAHVILQPLLEDGDVDAELAGEAPVVLDGRHGFGLAFRS